MDDDSRPSPPPLPPELEEQLHAYFAAFLSPVAAGEAVDEVKDDISFWGDHGRVDVFRAAHVVLSARARVTSEVEALVLVEDAALTVAESANVLGTDEGRLRAVLADAFALIESVESADAPADPVAPAPEAHDLDAFEDEPKPEPEPGTEAGPGTPASSGPDGVGAASFMPGLAPEAPEAPEAMETDPAAAEAPRTPASSTVSAPGVDDPTGPSAFAPRDPAPAPEPEVAPSPSVDVEPEPKAAVPTTPPSGEVADVAEKKKSEKARARPAAGTKKKSEKAPARPTAASALRPAGARTRPGTAASPQVMRVAVGVLFLAVVALTLLLLLKPSGRSQITNVDEASIEISDARMTDVVDSTGNPGPEKTDFTTSETVRLWFTYDRRTGDNVELVALWYLGDDALYTSKFTLPQVDRTILTMSRLFMEQPGPYRVEIREGDITLLTQSFTVREVP